MMPSNMAPCWFEAESKTENVIIAKQAGVNNYIVKPFNAETLKTKLSSVLGEF